MNGTISVTSKEGEGSTFVIRIPFEIASKVEEITDDKERAVMIFRELRFC